MPRESRIKRNKNYDATPHKKEIQIERQSGPLYIDNFRQGPRPTNAAQFAGALEDFTGAMAHAKSGLFADMENEKKRKGAISGFLGIGIDEVPDEPVGAAEQARSQMQGKIGTAEFKTQLDNFFAQNKDIDPAEYQMQLGLMKREFLKGKDRSYIEGFLRDGLAYEQQAHDQFVEYRDRKDTDDFLNEVGGVAHAELKRLVNEPTFTPEIRAELLHQMVRNSQELGAAYKGLSHNQINEKIVDSIGIMAVREGRPDLMDFVLLRDESGVSLWDTGVKLKAANYIKAAEAERDGVAKAEAEAKKLARKATEAEASRGMVDALYSENPAKVTEAMEYMVTNRDLFTPEKYEHFMGIYSELRSGDDTMFAKNTNQDVLIDMLVSADDGELSLQNLRSRKEFVSRNDYLKVFERITKQKEQAIKDAKSKGKVEDPLEDSFKDMKTSFKQEMLLSGDFIEKDNPFGTDTTRRRQRWSLYYLHSQRDMLMAQRAQEKKPFTERDLLWCFASAKRKAYLKISPMKAGQANRKLIDKQAPDPGNYDGFNSANQASKEVADASSKGRLSFDDI